MISKRQYEHLTEMGITLYQSRENNSNIINDELIAPDELSSFLTEQLFLDVLMALSLDTDVVRRTDTALDLGTFNWQFQESSDFVFDKNTLISPPLKDIKNSATLKRHLWQLITEQLL